MKDVSAETFRFRKKSMYVQFQMDLLFDSRVRVLGDGVRVRHHQYANHRSRHCGTKQARSLRFTSNACA